jgi:hypothetical protein
MERDMSTCIESCLRCYRTCLDWLGTRGVAVNDAEHIRLMMVCAEICRTTAHIILLRSPHHGHVCEDCAAVCTECATECERIGGTESCVEACRFCADNCRKMAI